MKSKLRIRIKEVQEDPKFEIWKGIENRARDVPKLWLGGNETRDLHSRPVWTRSRDGVTTSNRGNKFSYFASHSTPPTTEIRLFNYYLTGVLKLLIESFFQTRPSFLHGISLYFYSFHTPSNSSLHIVYSSFLSSCFSGTVKSFPGDRDVFSLKDTSSVSSCLFSPVVKSFHLNYHIVVSLYSIPDLKNVTTESY